MRTPSSGPWAAPTPIRHGATNLRANPRVSLQDGKTTRDYDARELDGDERAIWWERAVAAFPEYARFQKRTERRIPVFVLEPIDDGSPPRK